MADLIMPKMGDAMTEGKVIRWMKQPGDAVKKGDFIAVKAKRVGFMRSSSSGDTYLFEPPLGSSYRSRDTTTGNMLIQFQYAS